MPTHVDINEEKRINRKFQTILIGISFFHVYKTTIEKIDIRHVQYTRRKYRHETCIHGHLCDIIKCQIHQIIKNVK